MLSNFPTTYLLNQNCCVSSYFTLQSYKNLTTSKEIAGNFRLNVWKCREK